MMGHSQGVTAAELRDRDNEPTILARVEKLLEATKRGDKHYIEIDITYGKNTIETVRALFDAYPQGASIHDVFPQERCREVFATEECCAAETNLRERGFTVEHRPYCSPYPYGLIGCDLRVVW